MKRVFVTGIGVISPIGIGRRELWAGLRSDRSGICRISRFDASEFHCQVAGEVHGFQPEQWIPGKALRRMDRYSRFSVAAALQALEDACVDIEREDRARVGCFLGSALGGVGFGEIQYPAFHRGGIRAVDPALALSVFGGAGSCNIAIHLGLTGPVSCNADSCASGPIAIGRGLDAIRSGKADMVLAGAAEAPLTPLVFGAFDLIRAMSCHFNDQPGAACRPFDRARDGFVMGEGAAVLVLESGEHALMRGARRLAEVAGYSLTNDGHHITAPRPDATRAKQAIRDALIDARCDPGDVDAISAHGSSTPLNDRAETLAIKQALGEHAGRAPVIGTKPRHGHSLGAAGAIEVAIFALALHHQWLPGAMNLDDPDDGCDLDYGRNGPASRPLKTVLSNSFGFGGINSSLVLRAADLAG